jgi:hypothetical protein
MRSFTSLAQTIIEHLPYVPDSQGMDRVLAIEDSSLVSFETPSRFSNTG